LADIADQMEQINHHDDEHDQSSNEENTHHDQQQLLFRYLAESLQKQQQTGPIDFSTTSNTIKQEALDMEEDDDDDEEEDIDTVNIWRQKHVVGRVQEYRAVTEIHHTEFRIMNIIFLNFSMIITLLHYYHHQFQLYHHYYFVINMVNPLGHLKLIHVILYHYPLVFILH
jgi:hypothetical protein